MQVVQAAQMHSMMGREGSYFPTALGIRCGHCQERSRFVINRPHERLQVGQPPVELNCPNCRDVVRLYTVDKAPSKPRTGWLFVHPHAEERTRLNLDDLGWPKPLVRAYEECNGALDAGLWIAAAGQARRTLEGVLKHMLGDQAKSREMADALLKKLPDHVELDKPIKEAADVLREGGNAASHFDLNATPDEPFARGMVQLLDDLIEYLFLLPTNVSELRALLDRKAEEEDEYLQSPEEEPAATG